VAAPAWIDRSDADAINLVSADRKLIRAAARRQVRACLVADEFETYESIHGVIVRGVLQTEEHGDAVSLRVEKTAGFTFAGTLPPELVEEPGPD